METRNSRISIIMLPWLAHGHVSPFFELAKLLASKNFHIFFCSTPATLLSIKPKLTGKLAGDIELVELHLPSSPELPPDCHTTNGLPPHLIGSLKQAFDTSAPAEFSGILRRLNPDLVLYDFLQPWAPSLSQSAGIPAVIFSCTGALMASMAMNQRKNPNSEFFSLFPEIRLSGYDIKQLEKLIMSDINNEILGCFERSCDVVLVKTFRKIEGKYIDFLSRLLGKKVVAVGPLVQNSTENTKSETIEEWLNAKERSSSIFVSFGSEFYLSKKDMEEIAYGLEMSKVNFIWVVRFAGGERVEIEEKLPEGFRERVGERGMVVENWGPQEEILRHKSIGGFVSHCGWSSVMESIKFRVPIIGIGMHLDQPLNARLVEKLGIGVAVERETGMFGREQVGRVIRQVMVGKRGEELKKKMKELGEMMDNKQNQEIQMVVKELVNVCQNKKMDLQSDYRIGDDGHCYKVRKNEDEDENSVI